MRYFITQPGLQQARQPEDAARPQASRLKRAFTLIELLVVVSIIALLIAILLPVLGSVRESARTTICASNQRQLGIAAHSFAGDNRDFLPTHYDPRGPVEPNTIGSPVLTYRIAQGNSANTVEEVGMGRLIEQRYVETPEVFFCPSQDAPEWQQQHFPAPFGEVGTPGLRGNDSQADGSTFLVRGNYMFNPLVAFGSNSFGPKPRLYQTVTQFDSKIGDDIRNEFPGEAPLWLDLLIGWGYNTNAHDQQSVFQVAFIDGRVETFSNSTVTRFYTQETPALETINHETFRNFLLTPLLYGE